MSQTLGRAVLDLDADGSNLNQKLNQTEQSTKGWLGKLGGFMSKSLSFAIGGGMLQMATKAFQGIKNQMGDIIQGGMGIETLGKAFENTADKIGVSASDMLGDLQKASGGMIENADLMKQLNSAYSLVGTGFAKEMPNMLEGLRKISAATGEDMDYLMTSLVKGVGRLQPLIVDNLGIQVPLSEAYEKWAKANGMAVSEMTKAQQQTAYTEAIMEKLAEVTEGMPDTLGSAQQKWEALKTTMGNFKTEIGAALLPVIVPMISALRDFATAAIPVVTAAIQEKIIPALMRFGGFLQDNVFPVLSQLWTWLSTNIPPAIAYLSGLWTNTLQPAIMAVWEFIQANLLPIFQTLIGGFKDNMPAAINILVGIWNSVLKPAIMFLYNIFTAVLLPIISAVADAFRSNLGTQTSALSELWNDTLAPALEKVWGFMNEFVLPALVAIANFIINNVIPAIVSISQWLGEKLVAAFTGVVNVVTWVIDLIQKFKDGLANLKDKLPDWLTPGSPTPLENGLVGLTTAFGTLTQTSLPLLVSMFDTLQGILNVIATQLPVAINIMTNLWLAVFIPALTTVAEFLKVTFLPVITELDNFIKYWIIPTLQLLVTWIDYWTEAWGRLFEYLTDFLYPMLVKLDFIINSRLAPHVRNTTILLFDMRRAFWSITREVETLTDAIGDLIEAFTRLDEVIPDILRPGSPTPFEIGLRGITEAMRTLGRVSVPVALDYNSYANAVPVGINPANLRGATINQNSYTFNMRDSDLTEGKLMSILKQFEDLYG